MKNLHIGAEETCINPNDHGAYPHDNENRCYDSLLRLLSSEG
jgi:hypothetical protein